MDNESVRQGATLPLLIEVDDETAETATITVKESVEAATVSLTKTASFTGTTTRTADLTLEPSDTDLAAGEYVYQIAVNYSDGTVDKFPDTEGCDDGECDFPTLTICASLDVGVS